MKIYQKSYLNVHDFSVRCGQVYERIKLQSNTAVCKGIIVIYLSESRVIVCFIR